MIHLNPQFTRLLLTAPLICGGPIGAVAFTTGGSCLTSQSFERSEGREDEPSFLTRGYVASDMEDLVYSIQVMEKLRTYLVDQAESFSPEEITLIDNEFWNLA